ncbi:hypothetical protein EFP20_17120 [Burkholderia glumae]|nr:hypothetical protein NCPPB3923_01005 [Burkholderia glumae]PJO22169.1 hypothetical protein Y5A_015755 [Burkholderia glumae AU6208]PNL04602.1 hypothetical protein CEQ24_001130 [Burkholderia glumae]UVS92626.1 hypothetical protein EFP17_23215 [Burkholderia glumae]UVS98232.1 hypothetical protein EFP19_21020 [Burkholderia glumae]
MSRRPWQTRPAAPAGRDRCARNDRRIGPAIAADGTPAGADGPGMISRLFWRLIVAEAGARGGPCAIAGRRRAGRGMRRIKAARRQA